MHWWGRCAAAFILFLAFLGRSGGGLGPSSVCGDLNALYVLGTFVTGIAVPILFVIAAASTIAGLSRRLAPAVGDAPPPPYSNVQPTDTGVALRTSLVGRLLPGAVVVGLALFVLAGPSGCVPFRVCAQGNEVARASGSGVRFVGEAPPSGPSADAAYTATFDARAPWTLRWSSTADRARLDVFTSDAMQQGRYFPELGHPGYVDDGPSGSTIVNASGTFCVRVALRDTTFESARNAYYSESRHSGPLPSSRPMSWELAITSP